MAAIKTTTMVKKNGKLEPVYPKTSSEQVLGLSERISSVAKDLADAGEITVRSEPIIATTYQRRQMMYTDKTTVTIPKGTKVLINEVMYYAVNDTIVSLNDAATAATRAGKDMYVYAVPKTDESNELTFKVSLNSTVPEGYTATNSRKIGGFHCLCLNVGTIANHQLSGYVTGDALPASVWDLRFRPQAEPEGMVFDERSGLWVDIYLASYDGSKLVSVYKGTIADGASTPKFPWYKFVDYFGRVKKRLPFQHEFMLFSIGSNQATNIAGSADPGTTGGHNDTAGRRMVAHIGCEDCCGVMWQWGSDVGSPYDTSNWTDAYDSNDDGDSLGKAYYHSRRVMLGADWNDGVSCGSRSSYLGSSPLSLYSSHGARGVCGPRAASTN